MSNINIYIGITILIALLVTGYKDVDRMLLILSEIIKYLTKLLK